MLKVRRSEHCFRTNPKKQSDSSLCGLCRLMDGESSVHLYSPVRRLCAKIVSFQKRIDPRITCQGQPTFHLVLQFINSSELHGMCHLLTKLDKRKSEESKITLCRPHTRDLRKNSTEGAVMDTFSTGSTRPAQPKPLPQNQISLASEILPMFLCGC